jgi:NADH-quinone oxidoreductase subunit N
MVLFSLLVKIFLFSFIDFNSIWSFAFLGAAVGSIAFGSISALFQKRVKRLFAYSTIAHTGFILLGIVVATPDSEKALIFYVVTYSLITILLFSLLIYSTKASNIYPKYLAN